MINFKLSQLTLGNTFLGRSLRFYGLTVYLTISSGRCLSVSSKLNWKILRIYLLRNIIPILTNCIFNKEESKVKYSPHVYRASPKPGSDVEFEYSLMWAFTPIASIVNLSIFVALHQLPFFCIGIGHCLDFLSIV